MTPPIVLASASEIRSQLLSNADIEHRVIPARIDEEMIKASLALEGIASTDMADALAEQKARKISARHPNSFVIGSDQVLDFQGKVCSKSSSPKGRIELLIKLNGKDHTVYSAAVIYRYGRPVWRYIGKVTVTMRELSQDYIIKYVSNEWENVRFCVGGYKIEDKGLRLFDRIDGDYFIILGLPLLEISRFLNINGALKK